MDPILRVELLGHFRLSFKGRAITGLSPRHQSLLAYLILNQHNPQLRTQIAFLFWPDSSDEQALTNLRRELHQLRHHLPQAEDFLVIDRRQLQWRAGPHFSLDVADFQSAVHLGSRAALEKAVKLYRGDLLPSCYEDWIVPERERLHGLMIEAYLRLIGWLEEDREYRLALEHAHDLLAHEPLHEGAYRALMRLHSLLGERAAALHAYHTCASLLGRDLGARPSAATQALYQRLLESDEPSQPTSIPPAGQPSTEAAYPLIGREQEWNTLRQTWGEAMLSGARCVVIQGVAGIGKTRLAEELLRWVAERGIAGARTRCYAAEGRLAFAPITEWLRSRSLRPGLEASEPLGLSEVARLLPELLREHPDLPRPPPLSESWQRQHFFEAVARCFLRDHRPLLLVLDDIQWCDPDTLEWLHYLLRSTPQAQLLLVATLRSEERRDNLALQTFLRDLRQWGRLSELELGPLNEIHTARLAAQVAGQPPDTSFSKELFRYTEGHPLFVVEMVQGGLPEFAHQLSPKVQGVITTRLAQLSSEAQDLVELAAVIGRDFTYGVLIEASDLDEKTLIRALDELWQRRIIREQGGLSYDFSHDLLREVSYTQTSPVRRQLLHRRVAQALELLYRENLDMVLVRLAYHHEQAGQLVKAVGFYSQAAQKAHHVSANEEAVRHLAKALSLLQQLPASRERDRQELSLQMALAPPLMTVRGYSAPQVEAVVTRMGELGRRLGQLDAVLYSVLGLQGVYYVRGNIRKSLDLAFEGQQLAKGYPKWLLISEWAIGGASLSIGALRQAKIHFERAITGYDSDFPINTVLGPDLAVFSRSWASHALWLLGYPEQALNHHRQALELAKGHKNPFNLLLAYAYGAILYQMLYERQEVLTCARRILELCAKYSFAYYRDWGLILSGWADADPARIRLGLDNLQTLEAGTRRPYYLGLLAETYVRLGKLEEAHSIVDAALANAAQNEDLWWSAELYRLKGELAASESYLCTALEIARTQESKALELRSAGSLARLWQEESRSNEARKLLEPIYGWFEEGLDTWDLHQARKLIQALST